ncbi:MAG: transglycosylase domain-containing protein, partial [Actinomycetota bacterium]|nr:transglycosylase domain-containing protein [Actinomycetota bacterium]
MSDHRLVAGVVAVRRLFALVLVSALAGVLVAGLVLPLAGLTGLAARNVANGIENLPAELDEVPIPQRTTVLASDGTPIAYFFDENRVDVSLEDVAPVMKRAMLAIEDSRFYEHGALDVQGTARAVINNALGEPLQGGSSITQQLVKQILVTQAETRAERAEATETSYSRKLRELQFAMAYEREYSKDQILESYLNIAYFGDSAYGIQEAARHYFSVDAADLNVRQAATLSGL